MSKQLVFTDVTNESDMHQQKRKTVCGCCSLRTGTAICGIVCMLFFSLALTAFGIFYVEYTEYYHPSKNTLLQEFAGFIVSALCIHGAVKENRCSLLPWLVFYAIDIAVNFLKGFYFILYGSFEVTMLGIVVLMVSGLSTYFWICVANYYTELRNRDNNNIDTVLSSTRNYINPSAVTNPAAFSTETPPAYSVAVAISSPALDEKPPCYEDVEQKEKENAECKQQQQL